MVTLFKHVKQMGDLKVFDTRHHINLSRVYPEFARLQTDPYLAEGYRRKHILWVKPVENRYHIHKNNVLYQSKSYNPVHGGLERRYPPIDVRRDPAIVKRILDVFVECAQVPENHDILLQFQRITTEPGNYGKPSVEGWHRDGVNKIGIICVERNNILGGMNEFKVDDVSPIFQQELPPGFMAIFNDADVFHRVTEIEPADHTHQGHRDVILMSF